MDGGHEVYSFQQGCSVALADVVLGELVREGVVLGSVEHLVAVVGVALVSDLQLECVVLHASLEAKISRGFGHSDDVSNDCLVDLYVDDLFAEEVFDEVDQLVEVGVG